MQRESMMKPPSSAAPAAFAARIPAESARWSKVAREANVKVE